MSLGDVVSPALTLSDTAVSILKDTTINGDIVADNHLPKATIEASYQPILSSVANGGVFHTVLGDAGTSAENKMKAISGIGGVKITSVFDNLNISLAPLEGFMSTVGHGQLTSSSGLSAFSSTQWGRPLLLWLSFRPLQLLKTRPVTRLHSLQSRLARRVA